MQSSAASEPVRPSLVAGPVHLHHRTPPAGNRARTGLVVVGHGIVLPNRRLTPGAVNPRVTQSDIHSTICVSGFTASERPPSSYTTGLKIRQLAIGYAFHGDRRTADYEEDHLISLELGGSATSPKNLWPEPYAAREGARVKDRIENKLHDLVCAGALSLHAAQHAIATNWWLAYAHYISKPVPRRVVARQHTAPAPVVAAPVHHGCTTTSSGTCIRGGEFCPQAKYGMTGYDAGGTAYVCTGDRTHPHWV